MAMASENSARGQPNSIATGSWNTPNEARMAKPTSTTRLPARRTGVMTAERWVSTPEAPSNHAADCEVFRPSALRPDDEAIVSVRRA